MCVPTPVFLLSSTVQTPASTALPTAPVSRLFAPMSVLLFWREAVYTDRYKYSTTVSTMFTATGAETETCGCCCWSWWCNFLILNWTDLNWTSSTINLVTNFHCRHSLSSPETSWFSKWAVLLLTKSKHRSPETAEDQAKTSHLLQAHVVAVGRNFSRRLSDVKWNPAGVWFKARSVNKGAVCWTTFRRTTKHPSSPILHPASVWQHLQTWPGDPTVPVRSGSSAASCWSSASAFLWLRLSAISCTTGWRR